MMVWLRIDVTGNDVSDDDIKSESGDQRYESAPVANKL
tara:strand:+ start:147 stop:260 length:114 start_codon:yes stop_codon:yes gene_type:complete